MNNTNLYIYTYYLSLDIYLYKAGMSIITNAIY